MACFQAGKYSLPLGKRAYVMGILNVTPDSFSDGGRFLDPGDAVEHALAMQEQGADIIDIGAQSTRPGHVRISPEEEMKRLLPVLERLMGKLSVPVSVDTFYPGVAEAALAYGIDILNDVTGFDHPGMIETAAKASCGCIVMHHTASKIANPNIIENISLYFAHKIKELTQAGIPLERICLDPGVGFGKTHEENLRILSGCGQLRIGDCALLIGASRKRVIGSECGDPPAESRVAGTVAAHSIAVFNGADLVRAHDVPEAVQSSQIAFALRRCHFG